MICVGICEDHPGQTQIITALLEQYLGERPSIPFETFCYNSGADLLEHIKAGKQFQLLLLDIVMPEINGIDLAREIRTHLEDAVVIFLTVSKDHALEAYGVSAAQYILKPITKRTLFPVLDRVFPAIGRGRERYFLLSTADIDVKIPFSSIVSVELNDRRLRVCLENGDVLLGKCVRTSFKDTVAALLKDERFVRVHNSFVINMEQAEAVKKDAIIMKCGGFAPISRPRYSEVKKMCLAFAENAKGRTP